MKKRQISFERRLSCVSNISFLQPLSSFRFCLLCRVGRSLNGDFKDIQVCILVPPLISWVNLGVCACMLNCFSHVQLFATWWTVALQGSLLKNIYLFIWLCQVLVAACGISFPYQGLNPGPLNWELGMLATGLPGKPRWAVFVLESGYSNPHLVMPSHLLAAVQLY